MREWLKKTWCSWFHPGSIGRDELGRINWKCSKPSCGRWSDYPIPLDEERRMTDEALTVFARSTDQRICFVDCGKQAPECHCKARMQDQNAAL